MFPHLRTLAIGVAIGLAPLACQQQATEEEGAIEEEVTGADIQTTIEETNTQFEQAMLATDTRAMVAGYADDAIVMPPFMPAVTGKDEIRGLFGEMVAEGPPSSFDIVTENVTVAESGEIAYETGSYTASGTDPEGIAWEVKGKYLSVWEKGADGQWKTTALSWNPDAPPPGMEGAGQDTAPATKPAETQRPAGEETAPSEEAEPAPSGEAG